MPRAGKGLQGPDVRFEGKHVEEEVDAALDAISTLHGVDVSFSGYQVSECFLPCDLAKTE